jgi:hypothetical protein
VDLRELVTPFTAAVAPLATRADVLAGVAAAPVTPTDARALGTATAVVAMAAPVASPLREFVNCFVPPIGAAKDSPGITKDAAVTAFFTELGIILDSHDM